jgi:hypothetical protein
VADPPLSEVAFFNTQKLRLTHAALKLPILGTPILALGIAWVRRNVAAGTCRQLWLASQQHAKHQQRMYINSRERLRILYDEMG